MACRYRYGPENVPIDGTVYELFCYFDVVVLALILLRYGTDGLTEETVSDAQDVGLVNDCQVLSMEMIIRYCWTSEDR